MKRQTPQKIERFKQQLKIIVEILAELVAAAALSEMIIERILSSLSKIIGFFQSI